MGRKQTTAFEKAAKALDLFSQARSGLEEANAQHDADIIAKREQVQTLNNEVSQATEARAKNAKAIEAISTLLGE